VESRDVSRDEAVIGLKRERPVDVVFVTDIGQMIREPLLSWGEKVGCLNIHPSALPLYRGAAPIQRALMDGAQSIGVAIFKLSSAMDAGPVLLRETVGVSSGDDYGSLLEKAAVAGAGAFVDFAETRPVESWVFEPQDEARATYAPKIDPSEERIDWTKPALEIANLARALSPKPGAWTTFMGHRLSILSALPAPGGLTGGRAPGEPSFRKDGVRVACGDGALELLTVKPEGGKPQSAGAWKNGIRAPQEVLFE
jgi:methionyl-tRNA formyltransferase